MKKVIIYLLLSSFVFSEENSLELEKRIHMLDNKINNIKINMLKDKIKEKEEDILYLNKKHELFIETLKYENSELLKKNKNLKRKIKKFKSKKHTKIKNEDKDLIELKKKISRLNKDKKIFDKKREELNKKEILLLDKERKLSLKEKSLQKELLKIKNMKKIVQHKNIDKDDLIIKNFNKEKQVSYRKMTTLKGLCSLFDNISQRLIVSGKCKIKMKNINNPNYYSFSFGVDGRSFTFKKENKRWYFLNEGRKEVSSFKSNNKFLTENYRIEFSLTR